MSGPSGVGFSNPILYIEELRRFPLNRSRVPAPGTALVFRTRAGQLRVPPGGWTAGEMLLFGPRTGYRIDTAPHGFRASFPIGASLTADVEGRWTVVDPVEVVANRISDLEYACVTELREHVTAALDPKADTADEVRERLTTAFADGVTVPGGVRLDELRVSVSATDVLTGERVIQALVADDEEPDPGDPGGADPAQLVQELTELARQALAEHGTEGAAGRALARFHDVVTRMGDVLDDR
ncbi:hypothetical protein [Actinoplanes aureus]|uniref:SPFH domain-containing protein n=1 Tax=Actinoplanes aureus TaxID=2792083 RepID=A0A931CB87_9ACTN|nr:hypothetical protein [Actinoplanes aureus]MBG0565504.1 hypothetical protein [Actinoplanes aureus]